MPERGARLGNFGVTDGQRARNLGHRRRMDADLGSELHLPVENKYGSDGSVFVARLHWAKPEQKCDATSHPAIAFSICNTWPTFLVRESLTHDTRHTEPRFAGNLKACCRGTLASSGGVPVRRIRRWNRPTPSVRMAATPARVRPASVRDSVLVALGRLLLVTCRLCMPSIANVSVFTEIRDDTRTNPNTTERDRDGC